MATSASPTIHIAVDTSQARKGITDLGTALNELQKIYEGISKDAVKSAKTSEKAVKSAANATVQANKKAANSTKGLIDAEEKLQQKKAETIRVVERFGHIQLNMSAKVNSSIIDFETRRVEAEKALYDKSTIFFQQAEKAKEETRKRRLNKQTQLLRKQKEQERKANKAFHEKTEAAQKAHLERMARLSQTSSWGYYTGSNAANRRARAEFSPAAMARLPGFMKEQAALAEQKKAIDSLVAATGKTSLAMAGGVAAQAGRGEMLIRQTTGAFKEQTSAMYDLRGAARGLSGSLGMLWTTYGSLAPLLAGAAIAGTARSAFNVGKDLEYRLAMVEAVSGEKASVSDLMPAVLGSMKTPLEAAEAMQALAQAGMKVQDALTALPAVTSLATVGELDMSDAAVTLTASINAFNLEATDATRVADVFAKTASISTTTVAQITGAMRQASTNAGQFRISVEETSAALAVMAERNITGSLAGTAFRNMTKELYTPIARGAKALDQLGISAYDSEGKMRDFVPILKDLHTSLTALTEESRDAMLEAIFGERGSRAIKPILNDFGAYLDKLEELEDATGFLAQANAKLLNTVEGAMNRLQSSMEQVKSGAFESARHQIVATIRDIDDTLKTSEFGDALTFIIRNVADFTKALASNLDLILKVGAGYAFLRVGTGALALTFSKVAEGISTGSRVLAVFKARADAAAVSSTAASRAVGGLGLAMRGLTAISGVVGVGMMIYTLYNVIADIRKIKKDAVKDLKTESARREFKDYTDQLVDTAEQLKATYDAIGDDDGMSKRNNMIDDAVGNVERLRREEAKIVEKLDEQQEKFNKINTLRERSNSLVRDSEKAIEANKDHSKMLVELMGQINAGQFESLKLDKQITAEGEVHALITKNKEVRLAAVQMVLDKNLSASASIRILDQGIADLTAEQAENLRHQKGYQEDIVRATQAELMIRSQLALQASVGSPVSDYSQQFKQLEREARNAKIGLEAAKGINTEAAKLQRETHEATLKLAEPALKTLMSPAEVKSIGEQFHYSDSGGAEAATEFITGQAANLVKVLDAIEAGKQRVMLAAGSGGGRSSFDDPNTILKRMTVSTITDQLKHQATVAKVAEAHLRDVRDAQLELDKQYMSEGALYALAARNKAGDRYNALLDKAKENIEKLQEAMKAATDETAIANAQAALDLEYKRVEALEEQKRLAEERAEIEGRQRHDEDNTFFNKLRKHYSDAANDAENFSDVMKNAGVSAFQTMGDALEDLVVKGKLDFRSLAISILEDMSRMMFRWMMMQALGMFADGGFTGFGKKSPPVAQAFPVDMRRWTGGYTGDGGKFQPMGVVHGGEYVLNKEATSQLGLPMLDYMNRTGKLPTQGYATGGFVGNTTPWYPESAGRGNVNVTVNITDQGADVSADGAEKFGEDVAKMVEALIIKHEIRSNQPGGTAWRQRRGR